MSKSENIISLLEGAKKDAILHFPDPNNKYFPLLYKTSPPIEYILSQLNDFIDRIEFLDIYEPAINSLKKEIKILENFSYTTNKKDFKVHLDSIFENIDVIYNEEINEKLSKLTCQECIRLDEAITNFRNGCFSSSVIMAVSSVEARLHYLIKKKNKTLYKKYFETSPLGTLISLFDKNGIKFKDKKFNSLRKILPGEHSPLIEIFNIYRIYSAHPKDKNIPQKIAQSILNFTFVLLLDEKLQISDKRLLKHQKIIK